MCIIVDKCGYSSFVFISGNDVDFNSTMQTVTIVAGTNSSTLNVTLNDDDIVEENQTFKIALLVLSSPGSKITPDAMRNATGIIIDTNGKCYC